jgi:hypothetical protein
MYSKGKQITRACLLTNDDLLRHSSDSSKFITPRLVSPITNMWNLGLFTLWDGVVGAVLPNGKQFITSPNCRRWIPEPPMNTREVWLMEDGRFGVDDYLQWPQEFLPHNCHYPCIPLRPRDEHDNYWAFRRVWDTLVKGDLMYQQTVLGFDRGLLNPEDRQLLRNCIKYMEDRLDRGVHEGPATKLLDCYHTVAHLAYRQLAYSPSSFETQRFAWSVFFRMWVSILSWYDYMTWYKPRMEDASRKSEKYLQWVVGTISNDPHIIDSHVRLGIPVWVVRPVEEFSSQIIKEIMPVTVFDDTGSHGVNIKRAAPELGYIFKGSTLSQERYDAMILCCKRMFVMNTDYRGLPSRGLPSQHMSTRPSNDSGTKVGKLFYFLSVRKTKLKLSLRQGKQTLLRTLPPLLIPHQHMRMLLPSSLLGLTLSLGSQETTANNSRRKRKGISIQIPAYSVTTSPLRGRQCTICSGNI